MAEPITPAVLAAELGVSDSAVRRWLRAQVDRGGEVGPWLLDDCLVAKARDHFTETAAARARRPSVCTVNECERAVAARGLCRMHYKRWDRHGTTDRLDGADHQRTKTHCPHGHLYDKENTIVYVSDGRRRCLACRRGHQRAN